MLETVNSLELAADVKFLGGAEEVLDTGVGVVVATKDVLGFVDPVVCQQHELILGLSSIRTCRGGRRLRW